MIKTKLLKLRIVVYTGLLFLLETFGQIIYLTIKTKYFEPFHDYSKLGKVFSDTLFVIGSVKLVFYFPIYVIFYLSKIEGGRLRISFYHALIFFSIYMVTLFILPGGLGDGLDIIILTLIAFLSSFIIGI